MCSIRKISYSTLTIVDVDEQGLVQIAEYDNPRFVLIRDGRIEEPEYKSFSFNTANVKRNQILCSRFQAQERRPARLLLRRRHPVRSGYEDHTPGMGRTRGSGSILLKSLDKDPEQSATRLATNLVRESLKHDVYTARDDITCGSLYFRKPRNLMIATGPSLSRKERDRHLAGMLSGFDGRTIVSGGTTANIIARELGRESLELDLAHHSSMTVPPASKMEGISLVTEGIITMSTVYEYLKAKREPSAVPKDPAESIVREMLDSDIIHFLVGTKINEAHQDPTMPVTLEIRRNLIKNIADLLKKDYFKDVEISYI